MANGDGASAKVWLGATLTTASVGTTSLSSPTTTTSKVGSMRGSATSVWSGPMRSRGVSPGYRTNAICFGVVVLMGPPVGRTR
jgi:hypothetical protein